MELRIGEDRVLVELLDKPLAKRLHSSLPVEGSAKLWGDELYFTTQLSLPADDLQEVVEPGDVCWWAPGSALCFFWGPTPGSLEDECRPASAVTVIGRMKEEDFGLLARVSENEPLVVRKVKVPVSAGVTKAGEEPALIKEDAQ